LLQRLFMSLVLLVMIAIAGLIAAPLLLDLEQYKKELAYTIEDSTGLKPDISGTISVSFFPTPTVEVSNVSIKNIENATSANIIHVESISVNSSFQALLTGSVDIKNINLVRPVIELEVMKDGTQNWEMIKQALKRRNVSEGSKFPEQIEIQNGTLSYRAKGKKSTIDYISSDIRAAGANGPFSMEGNFSSNTNTVKFEGDIDELTEGAAADFLLSSDSFSILLTGNYKGGKEPKIEGKLDGKVTNLGKLIEVLFDNSSVFAKIKSNEKLDLSGRFSFSKQIASFNNITIDSDSIKGNAGIDALLGEENIYEDLQWDVNVGFNKIDFDKLLTDTSIKNQDETEIDYYASSLTSTSISDYKFDIPSSLSAIFNFKIDEITYNNDKIKNLRIDTDIYNGKAIIHEISADIPGDSSFKITGHVEHNGTRPLLKGNVELVGNNMRQTLVWLKEDASFIPQNSLQEYIISFGLKMTPQKIDISDAQISVDKSLIKSNIAIRPVSNPPVIKADLTIDKLNLDKYNLTDKVSEITANFFTKLSSKNLETSWLKMFGTKFDLSVEASDLVFNNHKLDNSVVSLAISRGIFNLKNLILDSPNASLDSLLYIDLLRSKPLMNISAKSEGFDTSFIFGKDQTETTAQEFKWSNEPFKFMGIGRFNGILQASFKSLKHNDIELKNLFFKGQNQNQIFSIEKANTELYGGKLILKGNFGISENNPSMGISLAGSNIDINPLLKTVNNNSGTKGKLYFTGTIKAFGNTPLKWISNLEIDADVKARKLAFNKFDLNKIITSSRDVYSVIDMNTIVKNASSEGTTIFDNVEGKITSEKGILKASGFKVSNRLSRGAFAGNLSLANFSLNGIGKIGYRPERGKNVNLNIILKGNFNNIEKTIDTAELENYITSKGSR
jgi:hypothetical protein